MACLAMCRYVPGMGLDKALALLQSKLQLAGADHRKTAVALLRNAVLVTEQALLVSLPC